MFADMELIGIPQRLVISERNLAAGQVEYRGRRDAESTHIPLPEVVTYLSKRSGASE